MNLLTAVLRLDRLDKMQGRTEALTSLFTLQDWEDLSNKKSEITKVPRPLPWPPSSLPTPFNPPPSSCVANRHHP